MPRRYRRRRKKPSNTGVQLIQIVGLGLILATILFFRDELADNAGKFFGVMGSDDVRITLEGEDAAGTSVDAGVAAETGSGAPGDD